MAVAVAMTMALPGMEELARLLQRKERLSVRALSSVAAALIVHERLEEATALLEEAIDHVASGRKKALDYGLADVYYNLAIALASRERHEVTNGMVRVVM